MANGNGDTAVRPAEVTVAPRAAVMDHPVVMPGVGQGTSGATGGLPASGLPAQSPAATEVPTGARAAAEGASTVAALQAAAREVAAHRDAARQNVLLGHLLKMADAYAATGKLRQATEAYFEILGRDDEAPAAATARQRLMTIAETYEHDNKFHQARSLFERLL
jgi:hypothetical protein